MHRRGHKRVAHAGVTLHIEPGRAKSALAAKANSLDSQFRDDVVASLFSDERCMDSRETVMAAMFTSED